VIILPATAFKAGSFPLPNPSAYPTSEWSPDQGIDIPAPAHTPLLAVGAGTIVGHGISGFGADAPILKLDTNGEYVYYGHAGPGNAVKVGTHVNAGQVIGEVGAGIVGISTGPHLEIGFSDVRGTPLGRSTAPTMKSYLEALINAPATASKSLSQAQQSLAIAQQGGSDAASGGVAGKLATEPSQIAAGIVSALWDAISSHAEYAALALVAIVGGFLLMGKGLSRTTHAGES